MGGFGEDVTFNSFGVCSIGMCEEENIEGRAVYITTRYLHVPVKYMYLNVWLSMYARLEFGNDALASP